MKLKQSNSLNKKIYLPQIKTIESHHFTPKYQSNNHSLPKIVPNNLEQIQAHLKINHSKRPLDNKKPLKERLKALYNRKRENLQFNRIENETSPKAIDFASITNRFQRQIERNLVHIKKVKDDNRREGVKRKLLAERYKTQEVQHQSEKEKFIAHQKSMRIATQQSVFSKINEIILTSQSKTSHAHEPCRNLSLNSYLNDPKIITKHYELSSRQKIKTEASQQDNSFFPVKRSKFQIKLKHNQNYHQWRKLSIDSLNNIQIKYDNSSYDLETDRLEKIRKNNDLSLRKYFEGKEYLQKLMSYRQSTTLPTKER